MARRSKPNDTPEALQQHLIDLLTNFSEELKNEDLRAKVVALVPAFHTLRDLGSSLIPKTEAPSARDRIIAYLKQYPLTVIDGDELMVVSGINEWARRVRELRVQFGWWIYSGVTFKQMAQNPDDAQAFLDLGIDPSKIKPDQYVLMSTTQDTEAAYRWNVLNDIRKSRMSVKDKIIKYFRTVVGKPVTGEELSYLAGNTKEWARRVRELRTEEGWPIATKNTGREDLPVGVYVLEKDRPVPFERMIYFGDGETDIPCMKMVKEHGGHSIAVYGNPSKKATAMKLIEENRVNFACIADYRKDKEMFGVVKRVLDKIKSDYEFERLLEVHKKKSVKQKG